MLLYWPSLGGFLVDPSGFLHHQDGWRAKNAPILLTFMDTEMTLVIMTFIVTIVSICFYCYELYINVVIVIITVAVVIMIFTLIMLSTTMIYCVCKCKTPILCIYIYNISCRLWWQTRWLYNCVPNIILIVLYYSYQYYLFSWSLLSWLFFPDYND